jgi:hypothetical protein
VDEEGVLEGLRERTERRCESEQLSLVEEVAQHARGIPDAVGDEESRQRDAARECEREPRKRNGRNGGRSGQPAWEKARKAERHAGGKQEASEVRR